MVLCQYNGKQFMVTDIAWRNFKEQYPERAKRINILTEPYSYFSFDDLLQFTNPTISETKKILVEAYINAEDKEMENLVKYNETDSPLYEKEYEKYHIATEVIQILSQRLLGRRIIKNDIKEYQSLINGREFE